MDENHIEVEEELIPDDLEEIISSEAECGEEYIYDEDGSFVIAEPFVRPLPGRVAVPPLSWWRPRPCSSRALKGSWYLQLTPQRPHTISQIRGPMRIEVDSSLLRVSGDIYVRRFIWPVRPRALEPFTVSSLRIAKRWYPQLPMKEYSWYFRSRGVSYSAGTLTMKLERRLWNRTTEEFTGSDQGWMRLTCTTQPFRYASLPAPTLKMTGEAMIGGYKYDVVATKTSPYYRGCSVEVDVMTNRQWPAVAPLCSGGNVSFTGVYRRSGLDFAATVDQINIPDDARLSVAEMQTLLAAHRKPGTNPDQWRLWLFVGSRMNGTFGLMFDQTAPHREGAVGFYDPRFSNNAILTPAARGQELGDVPLAFLRTLIHEAGHAFNLFHPKHDVHSPPIGTTIMNQTGDVMGFATTSDQYPCNATFGFSDHNTTSLIHSPDPQIRPGWKAFGWGHGSLFGGVAEPVDAEGLVPDSEEATDLTLDLELPERVYRGEYAIARFRLVNTGPMTREVTADLDLAHGDLQLVMIPPSGDLKEVRDVAIACGERRTKELKPDDSIAGRAQVLFTNLGFAFDEPGRYRVRAELHTGDGVSVVRSGEVTVSVDPPVNEKERSVAALSLNEAVGRSIALGDFGADTEARDRLVQLAETAGDTDTGAASALVLSNALDRDFVDYRLETASRDAEPSEASKYLGIALKGRSATEVMELATTVASPIEKDAPVVSKAMARLKRSKKSKTDMASAADVIADFEA